MGKLWAKLHNKYSAFRVRDRRLAAKIEPVLMWGYLIIAVVTLAGLLYIALGYPLSEKYTEYHRYSYVLMGIAGFLGIIVSLLSTKKEQVKGILVLVLELYLLGLVFQLFSLTL